MPRLKGQPPKTPKIVQIGTHGPKANLVLLYSDGRVFIRVKDGWRRSRWAELNYPDFDIPERQRSN